jgi:glycosyltransferase involved in cell wall biosynthesis
VVTDGGPSEPVHLVEVGLAWPPDTFLLRKLTGLAERGFRITIVANPGPPVASAPPGIEVVRMPDISTPGVVIAARAARECLRLLFTRPRQLGAVIAAARRRPRPSGMRRRLWWLWMLSDLAALRPDVVHFEWESAAVKYGRLVRLWRCPMVMSCRGGLALYSNSVTYAAALARVEDAFADAAAVHCVSEAMLGEAAGHGLDPRKAVVIRSAVDLETYRPAAVEPADRNRAWRP